MQKYFYITIIVVFLLFTSCYNYKEVSIMGVEDFQIKKINKDGMQTEVAVKIKNPNNFGFHIYSGKANIVLGRIPLGKASLMKKVHIPAHSTGTYKLMINTSFDKITMKDIISSVDLSNIQKVKIDGYIKVGKFLLRKKIPTNYEGNLLNPIQFNSIKN